MYSVKLGTWVVLCYQLELLSFTHAFDYFFVGTGQLYDCSSANETNLQMLWYYESCESTAIYNTGRIYICTQPMIDNVTL